MEFTEPEIQRIQKAFGLDREAAIARLEAAAARTARVATRSRASTVAGKLNSDEPGNVAGKPVLEGTPLDVDLGEDAREQIDETERDAVWADAIVLPHED